MTHEELASIVHDIRALANKMSLLDSKMLQVLTESVILRVPSDTPPSPTGPQEHGPERDTPSELHTAPQSDDLTLTLTRQEAAALEALLRLVRPNKLHQDPILDLYSTLRTFLGQRVNVLPTPRVEEGPTSAGHVIVFKETTP